MISPNKDFTYCGIYFKRTKYGIYLPNFDRHFSTVAAAQAFVDSLWTTQDIKTLQPFIPA